MGHPAALRSTAGKRHGTAVLGPAGASAAEVGLVEAARQRRRADGSAAIAADRPALGSKGIRP
jgi:hypothetical protein